MQETQAQPQGQEDPLEKGMAAHSSILAWRILWTEEPGGYSPWGCRSIKQDLVTKHSNNKAFLGSHDLVNCISILQ